MGSQRFERFVMMSTVYAAAGLTREKCQTRMLEKVRAHVGVGKVASDRQAVRSLPLGVPPGGAPELVSGGPGMTLGRTFASDQLTRLPASRTRSTRSPGWSSRASAASASTRVSAACRALRPAALRQLDDHMSRCMTAWVLRESE